LEAKGGKNLNNKPWQRANERANGEGANEIE
jgi:hypothetical protein